MGSDAEIGPSTFKSFVSVAATNFDYLHSQVEVETVSAGQKETMFVELKALHDDNDSYMSEYNIILSDGSFGGTNAGAFGTFGTLQNLLEVCSPLLQVFLPLLEVCLPLSEVCLPLSEAFLFLSEIFCIY